MSKTNYWLGIDGGGSHSEWILCDNDEQIINRKDGPALQASIQTIPEILDKLKSGFLNYDMDNLSGICVGLSGLGHPHVIAQLEQALEFYISGVPLIINSDAIITHRGTFLEEDGTLIITGTGSIILMRDNEQWHRKGGWGPKIGDPASGYSIGLSFIRKVLHGRLYSTYQNVLGEFYQESGSYKEQDLIKNIYNGSLKPSVLCPDVLQLASEGDEICENIINFELSLLMNLLEELHMHTQTNNRNIALHGGLIQNEYFQNQLQQHLHDRFKNVTISYAPKPPAIAACRVIMNKFK